MTDLSWNPDPSGSDDEIRELVEAYDNHKRNWIDILESADRLARRDGDVLAVIELVRQACDEFRNAESMGDKFYSYRNVFVDTDIVRDTVEEPTEGLIFRGNPHWIRIIPEYHERFYACMCKKNFGTWSGTCNRTVEIYVS